MERVDDKRKVKVEKRICAISYRGVWRGDLLGNSPKRGNMSVKTKMMTTYGTPNMTTYGTPSNNFLSMM